MSDKPVLAANELLKMKSDKAPFEWTVRQTMIYNLGIGFGAAAVEDEALLRFVLEEGTCAFPTMTAMMGAAGVSHAIIDPAYGVDFRMLMHGEEQFELFGTLPAEGKFLSDSSFDGVWDLGEKKGAVLQMSKRIYNAEDESLLAESKNTMMLRGNGGFGGSAEGAPSVNPAPDRAPDGSGDMATRPEQALIYRLAGDTNPLHSDPKIAKMAGFPKPILHGLCTYANCARILVRDLADNDETRLKFFKVRFSSPVYPGETIRVEHWHLGDGEYAFQARVPERDVIVIKGGQARIA